LLLLNPFISDYKGLEVATGTAGLAGLLESEYVVSGCHYVLKYVFD